MALLATSGRTTTQPKGSVNSSLVIGAGFEDIQRLSALVRAQQITIDKLEQARSAPVQEPVAIVDEDGVIVVCNYKYKPGDKLYTTPPAQRQRVVFPTMIRKMWSGGEVQAWLDENVNKENT